MAIFGIPIPAEIQQEIDRQNMETEAFRHDIARLLDELTHEQLFTFKRLLSTMQGESADVYISYLEGTAAAILTYKYGVCGGCGRDHSKELLADQSENKDQLKIPFPTDETSSTELKENLEKYNVSLMDESNPEGSVSCNSCGFQSQSLKDRMLRSPDTCIGCQHKAKWG